MRVPTENKNRSPMYYWNEQDNKFAKYSELVYLMKQRLNTTETTLTEDMFESFVAEQNYIPITYSMANEFFRDLKGTAKAKEVLPLGETEEVAELMGITIPKATCFLLSCAYYGVTEKQGGFWIYE